MRTGVGPNEALILDSLLDVPEATVADVASKMQDLDLGRVIDAGSIYLALLRMSRRGYVTSRKISVVSPDGRAREVGSYAITSEGRRLWHQARLEGAVLNRRSALAFGGGQP